MEELPEDSESRVGRDMPIGTSENLIALSAKIAAHELGHLLGLRHYDAFGPVGFGIHSPPGAAQFKPQYQGTSAAFETFDHIIGSPASVGTTRQNDIGQLFFGEREAVKIAFAASGPATGPLDFGPLASWTNEVAGSNTTAETAQSVSWKTISVPNTLAQGINAAKAFYVDTLAVSGEIQLAGAASENDHYSFAGNEGDVISIEVMSKALRRFSNGGVDNYIDSVVRLYRRVDATTIVPVAYYNSLAENDDEFESSDSVLFDVTLPLSAEYIIEVDTFTRGPRTGDPTPTELLALPVEVQANLADALQDTDVGSYELFVYRFAKASAFDDFDNLVGRGGIDVIDGGPGDEGVISIDPVQDAWIVEDETLSKLIRFDDVRGESWTVRVVYGDGVQPETFTTYDPVTEIPFSHQFLNDGNFEVHVTITNSYGVMASRAFTVHVANSKPELSAVTLSPASIMEAQSSAASGTFSDLGKLDAHTITINWGDGSADTSIPLAIGVFSFTSAPHVYADDDLTGAYTVSVTVADEHTSGVAETRTVAVTNVAPTATMSNSGPILVGGTVAVSFTAAFDPSSVDAMAGLRFSFALTSAGLAASYGMAVGSATANFTLGNWELLAPSAFTVESWTRMEASTTTRQWSRLLARH